MARFATDGWSDDGTLLVVARPKHWDAIARQLTAGGRPVDEKLADGTLVLIDAETTLSGFLRDGLPDSLLFHETVGALVRTLSERAPDGLRIYGEMVELLAEEGNFYAAQRLEELWNELAVRYSFLLMCGYSAAHFSTQETRTALTAICNTHNHVLHSAADPLAEWVLSGQTHLTDAKKSAGLPS